MAPKDPITADSPQKKSTKLRKSFQIETRFGGARELKSRKDRPCDACRKRKTACVIVTKPPCRFCENKCLTCSFITKPKPRRRSPVQAQERESEDGASPSDRSAHSSSPTQYISTTLYHTQPDRLSMSEIGALSPISMLSISDFDLTAASNLPVHSHTTSSYLGIPAPATSLQRYHSYPYLNSATPSPQAIAEGFNPINQEYAVACIPNQTAYTPGHETNYGNFSSYRVELENMTHALSLSDFPAAHDYFPEIDQRARTLTSSAIEGMVNGYGDILVRNYFEFVHPEFPVVSKGTFLRKYMQDKHAIPPSLRGAVYALASVFINFDNTSFQDAQLINQTALFEYVHASLSREMASPNLETLQACLLILHEQCFESGTDESQKAWILSGQAVSYARTLGLHHNPALWGLPEWEKRLRRKLWWATYYTDRWTSICYGSPHYIQNGSFDTSDIEIEDLVSDEDVAGHACSVLVQGGGQPDAISQAVRFIERIKLAKVLDNVLGRVD